LATRFKRNYLRTPEPIAQRIQHLDGDALVVGTTLTATTADIAAGTFAHLGLGLDAQGAPVVSDRVVPPPSRGRYSRYNVEGRTIVRRDLPKVSKTLGPWLSPNWGDWSNGSHLTSFDRLVYQRQVLPPAGVVLQVERLPGEGEGDACLFKVATARILDRTAPGFADDLLHDLNLVGESVGATGIYPPNATAADYAGTIRVSWSLLPVGERDSDLARILGRVPGTDLPLRRKIVSRYDVLRGLGPRRWVEGVDGFDRYLGALIRDDLVVLEHLEYGNAAYVMGENWLELSKKSRLELLASDRTEFVRVPHRTGWEERLRAVVDHRCRPPKQEPGQAA
jgi:hypothetical protein